MASSMKKIWEYCGKEYEPKYRNKAKTQKYCSKKCFLEFKKSTRQNKCAQCDNYIEFENKIIIEWYERKHYIADQLKKKDVIREKEIKKLFNDFLFLTIKRKDVPSEITRIIKEIKNG